MKRLKILLILSLSGLVIFLVAGCVKEERPSTDASTTRAQETLWYELNAKVIALYQK